MQDVQRAIILFDGVCSLCNACVSYIIEHDPDARFQFASLQSMTGRAIAGQYAIDADTLSSMVLIEGGRAYVRSSAVLRVCRHLSGPARVLWPLVVVPPVIRDAAYRFVAKRRYRWFGQHSSCRLPTKAESGRFL